MAQFVSYIKIKLYQQHNMVSIFYRGFIFYNISKWTPIDSGPVVHFLGEVHILWHIWDMDSHRIWTPPRYKFYGGGSYSIIDMDPGSIFNRSYSI